MVTQERRIRAHAEWRPRPTLSGPDYASAAVYEEERERLFFGTWICIGRADEISAPGEYLVRDLAGESILVIRNRPAELRAFYNVCAHRGTRLIDDEPGCGQLGKAFKCPYHAWSYDLDGRLLATPNVHEDESFARADYRLTPIAVAERAGFLFVNLAESRGPSRSTCSTATRRSRTSTAIGWASCGSRGGSPTTSPRTGRSWSRTTTSACTARRSIPSSCRSCPLFRFGEVWDGETRDGGNLMLDGATSFTPTGTSSLPTFPDLLPDDYGMYYGVFQFPNLMVNLHPDSVMAYFGSNPTGRIGRP